MSLYLVRWNEKHFRRRDMHDRGGGGPPLPRAGENAPHSILLRPATSGKCRALVSGFARTSRACHGFASGECLGPPFLALHETAPSKPTRPTTIQLAADSHQTRTCACRLLQTRSSLAIGSAFAFAFLHVFTSSVSVSASEQAGVVVVEHLGAEPQI